MTTNGDSGGSCNHGFGGRGILNPNRNDEGSIHGYGRRGKFSPNGSRCRGGKLTPNGDGGEGISSHGGLITYEYGDGGSLTLEGSVHGFLHHDGIPHGGGIYNEIYNGIHNGKHIHCCSPAGGGSSAVVFGCVVLDDEVDGDGCGCC